MNSDQTSTYLMVFEMIMEGPGRGSDTEPVFSNLHLCKWKCQIKLWVREVSTQ